MGSNVQVIFEDKLQKSNDFWVEAGLQKHLSLRRIFGNPSRHKGAGRHRILFCGVQSHMSEHATAYNFGPALAAQ